MNSKEFVANKDPISKAASLYRETRQRAQEHPIQGSFALVGYLSLIPLITAIVEEGVPKGVIDYFQVVAGTALGVADRITDDVRP